MVSHRVQSSGGLLHKVTTRDHAFGHRTQSILIYGSVGLDIGGPSFSFATAVSDEVAMMMPSSILRLRASKNEVCLDHRKLV